MHELKQLGKIQERSYRDQSFNEKFEIATFSEFVDVAIDANIGIYPETKEPESFNAWLEEIKSGTTVEELLMQELNEG